MIQFLEPGDTIQVMPFFDQAPPPGYATNQAPREFFCKCPDRVYSLVKPTPPATVDQVKALLCETLDAKWALISAY